MADRLEHMFNEVDRQLEEIREQCSAIANRVGFLISASAVVAAILATKLDKIKGAEVAALITLGAATILGTLALVPRIVIGPETSSLTSWAAGPDPTVAVSSLYAAKIETINGNKSRLQFMTFAFYLQVVAVVAAVVTAIAATAGR